MSRGLRILFVAIAVTATAVIHFQAKKLSVPDAPQARPSGGPLHGMESGSPLAGLPAPPLALTALDGQGFELAQSLGETVVLNFFATWCGPCRAEMPDLDRFAAAGTARGIRVIAVNVGEPRADVERFVREMGLTMRVLLDEDSSRASDYGVEAFPTTVLIDPQGVVRAVHVGMIEDFEAWYREAADQMSNVGGATPEDPGSFPEPSSSGEEPATPGTPGQA